SARLRRFHRQAVPTSIVPPGKWNGALVLDVNRDGRSDLFLVGAGQDPVLLLNKCSKDKPEPENSFEKIVADSPPLLQAQAIDLDFDGLTDVVGLSDKRKPVLLHNTGHRLVQQREALGADADWPGDLIGLVVADFDGD